MDKVAFYKEQIMKIAMTDEKSKAIDKDYEKLFNSHPSAKTYHELYAYQKKRNNIKSNFKFLDEHKRNKILGPDRNTDMIVASMEIHKDIEPILDKKYGKNWHHAFD